MIKMPKDVELLDRKIAELKAKEASLRHESKSDSDKTRASRIGLRICADLLSAVIVGAALGYVLDSWFGTKPWCLIVFLIFGGAAGILNVYRLAKAEENKK